MASTLSKDRILKLLRALNDELEADGIRGHVEMAGGAVMCLALGARDSTRDVDAAFRPSVGVLDAAVRVAAKEGVSEAWLNDAVKGYLSDTGSFETFLELSHLRVSCAIPEYMLAMKCLALRTGEGFHDEADIAYLIRNLGIREYAAAEDILQRYFPIDRYPEQNIAALRELIDEGSARRKG